MTLFDKPVFLASPYLLAQPVSFGGVLAQPERHVLPDGELLVFRFSNGYGAAMTRTSALADEPVYEFCVLECVGNESRPTFETELASGMLAGLDHDTATQLLLQAEQLPGHPQLIRADEALLLETF